MTTADTTVPGDQSGWRGQAIEQVVDARETQFRAIWVAVMGKIAGSGRTGPAISIVL
jgi:hypothetical protein